ncbi:MAG TPA: flavodoxin family protein [Baekduia sp.]|uniref:flavodoxin family protein n=1 Tax=Baekduia sp. TaxID=2600305 RepID=UPI002D77C30E|nr:flavodoxin family protein [Baekduia sp.]HET6506103.1 flavodoxin family protein [Baekduia sp.]
MTARRVLGLGCGRADGNADLLLKAALRGARDAGAEVSHVRLDDLRLGAFDEDAAWFWDQLMEHDGLIIGAPIHNRTVPGKLKLLLDAILGPKADVAFALEYVRMRDAGQEAAVRFPFDERVLRPRVGGFIAVGGANTDRWKALALPLMHHMTFSMQIGVVDQVVLGGAGTPASIVLDEPALERATLLGANVAEQLGRAFDDVEYRGAPGACPLCHLDAVVLHPGGAIECATCGAGGTLAVDDDGVPVARFDADGARRSVLTVAEKHEHFLEVQETAVAQLARADEVAAGVARHADVEPPLTPAAPAGAPAPPPA